MFFLLFIGINFSFFENFFRYDPLSSRLLSLEAALLLFYSFTILLFQIPG